MLHYTVYYVYDIILNTRLPSLSICIETFNFQKIYRLCTIYEGKKKNPELCAPECLPQLYKENQQAFLDYLEPDTTLLGAHLL